MIGNFGVTPTGVIIKQLTDIQGQVQTALQGDLGAAFSLLSQTPEGSLVNRISEQVADLWQFGEQVYNSLYPATASGPSLDQAESLVNVPRFPATASVYNGVTITGTSGTMVPTTFQVSVPGNPSGIFQLYQSVTIGANGTASAAFFCTATGPTLGPAGTLNILTAVAGVTAVSAGTAAQTGAAAETDSAYRVRAAQQQAAFGTGTFSGLLKAVQQVLNVSAAWLLTNDTDNTVNGLLPHSVLLIVVGGADQDILNAIYAAKGAGINTNGSVTGTVTDSQGTVHAVAFDRVADVPLYCNVTIVPNTNPATGPVFPANGLSLISSAIIAFAAGYYLPGYTAYPGDLDVAIKSVPGVTSFTVLTGNSYPPSGSSGISMQPYQLAQLLAGTDGSGNLYVNVHE